MKCVLNKIQLKKRHEMVISYRQKFATSFDFRNSCWNERGRAFISIKMEIIWEKDVLLYPVNAANEWPSE